MKLSPMEENLVKVFEDFEIIDAHEHLPPENLYNEQNVDALTLFSHYTRYDMITSGMPEQIFEAIQDPRIPLEKRWKMFFPFLENIKHGSYARAAFIAMKEFYGFDRIDDSNYKELSKMMAEQNKPGIYHRVLRERCKIRVALTQADSDKLDYDLDLLVPLMLLDSYAAVRSKKIVEDRSSLLNMKVKTLDDYLDLVKKGMEGWRSKGAVGIKMVSNPYGDPERGKAVALFDAIMRDDKIQLPEINPLRSYITDTMLQIASELGMVVAVHTGVWGDFRILDPTHMIPMIMRHPQTKFDIYHMGVPWVRETAIMGKNFPNVWLNLCWCHILSPKIACSAMDELIDLVPTNKIIAFGGDYHKPVEKVYGHLVMARENIAKVLAKRIEDGLMTEDEAVTIAEKWFFRNPRELYNLEV